MPYRVVAFGLGHLARLFRQVGSQLGAEYQITVVEQAFQEALAAAVALEAEGAVDVFVTAGGNVPLLREHLQTPVAGIQISGFDLLRAIREASQVGRRIGILLSHSVHVDMTDVIALCRQELEIATYRDLADAEVQVERLQQQGCQVIIGGSSIVDAALARGMHGIVMYSDHAVHLVFAEAVNLVRTRRREAENTNRFKAILDFAYSGIIATDAEGRITAFNPIAERITGRRAEQAIGAGVAEIIPHIRITEVLESGRAQYNQLQAIGNCKVLTNRVPIVAGNHTTGAVITFQDVDTIQEAEQLIRRNLSAKGLFARTTFADIVGESPVLRAAVERARRFADADSTVLITGESGTGKELFVQAIHNASRRRYRPFVAINCAALPETLLDSELFGYEEGAFTGARRGGKIGMFELAHTGTIFLDEVGELPLAMQARLLRVLQEREVMRIGGDRTIPVDCRVIAATNRDLAEAVRAGTFRSDLFYRLNVLRLQVPPLRTRPDDLLPAFLHLVQRRTPALAARLQQARAQVDAGLRRHHWPGNVRELDNIAQQLVALAGETADPSLLLPGLIRDLAAEVPPPAAPPPRKARQGVLSAAAAAAALAEHAGSVGAAAAALGVNRTTLWRRLRRDPQPPS